MSDGSIDTADPMAKKIVAEIMIATIGFIAIVAAVIQTVDGLSVN